MTTDCVTRVCALAIATAACIGLPSALVYAIVRVAAARHYNATFALGLFLVFWVTISAAYYPRVCADLVPLPRFLRQRRRRAPRRHRRGPGEPSLLVPQPASFAVVEIVYGDDRGDGGDMMGAFPWEQQPAAPVVGPPRLGVPPPYACPQQHQRVPSPPQRYGDPRGGGMFLWEASTSTSRDGVRASTDDDDVPPPPPTQRYLLYEQQRVTLLVHQEHGDDRRGGMAALPREPPAARGGTRAGADDDDVPRPPCEEDSDGEPSSSSKCCAICLADVDGEQTAKWLPMCLHVFHRLCIDQWLKGHSTCPICRCSAFLTDSILIMSLA